MSDRKPIEIHNWSVVPGTSNPYTPPEVAGIRVQGEVTDHPARPGRHPITTSVVVGVSGREVRTFSGSLYVLGAVDPGYVLYLASIGRTLDEAEPVKMVTR